MSIPNHVPYKGIASQTASNDLDVVAIGPNIVGWIYPQKVLRRSEAFAVMGDRKFPITHYKLNEACKDISGLLRDSSLSSRGMLRYCRRFAVLLPPNSVDFCDDGSLDYTERTARTLVEALEKFFRALSHKVQTEINSMSPVEAIRKCAELVACSYPRCFASSLTWRGKTLDELSQGTTMKAKVYKVRSEEEDISYESRMHPYSGCAEFNNLAEQNAAFKETGFSVMAELHVRNRYNRTRRSPLNVVHIQASSPEEYSRVDEMLFSFDDYSIAQLVAEQKMEKYLAKAHPDFEEDASFFLSMVGDPLEDWVDGEKVSAEEFCRF